MVQSYQGRISLSKKVREKLLIFCKNIYLCFFLGGAFFFAGAFLGDFLAAFFLGEEAGGGLDFLATTSEIPGMIKLCLLFSTVQGKKSKDFGISSPA